MMTVRGILASLLLVLCAVDLARSDELTNGDFEDSRAGSAPSGWRLFDARGSGLSPAPGANVVAGSGVDGSKGLCLAPPAGSFFNAGQECRGVKPGERVFADCRIRAEGLAGYAGLWLMGVGSRDYVEADRSAIRGDTGWLRIHAAFTAGAGCSGVRIKLGVRGPGKVWFDDVRLLVGAAAEQAEKGLTSTASATSWGLFHLEGRYAAQVRKPGMAHTIVLPIPIVMDGQAPLSFAATTEPPDILKSTLIEHRGGPNWVAKCTLRPAAEVTDFTLRMDAWVLSTLRDYAALDHELDLRKYRKRGTIPEEAQPWLKASKTVQCKDGRVKALSRKARKGAKSLGDLLEGIRRVMSEVFESYPGPEYGVEWDAVSTIKERTGCCGNANLVAAILRACGVPARILAGHPPRSGPHATHYVVEYFVPEFGWATFESSSLNTMVHPSGQIEVSRVTPQDEDDGVRRVGIGQPAFWKGTPLFSTPELLNAPNPAAATLRIVGAIRGENPSAPSCTHRAVIVQEYPAATAHALQRKLVELAAARWLELLKAGDAERLAPSEPFHGADSPQKLEKMLRAANQGR